MSLVKNFRMMSLYNQRVNTQLMARCLPLSKESLNRDTHSFFPNVISYWNHLLFGDLIMMSRLASNNIGKLTSNDFTLFPTPKTPLDIYFTDLKALAMVRVKLDALIVSYCANLTDEECAALISYKTTEGDNITKVASDVTQHMFNHQTHHRGQLTCVMSQLGLDYGCMDLPVIVEEGSKL